MRGSGAFSAMFLPFICLSGDIVFGGSGRSRALLAVSWLGACFTVVCLFYAVVCALCAWGRCFSSFVYHFIVVWRLPALRLLFAAVSALCPVVFGGFWRSRALFVLFAEFCVFFLMFLFVVGLFFFAPIFLHC